MVYCRQCAQGNGLNATAKEHHVSKKAPQEHTRHFASDLAEIYPDLVKACDGLAGDSFHLNQSPVRPVVLPLPLACLPCCHPVVSNFAYAAPYLQLSHTPYGQPFCSRVA